MKPSFSYRQMLLLFASALVSLATNSPLHAKSPGKGEPAPDFVLPQFGGDKDISLKEAISTGPVVVIVLRGYPGYQCPMCNQQVAAIMNRAPALAKLTKRVIFIYPGEATALDKHLTEFMGPKTFPEPLVIVRDPDMKMVTEYGLRWNEPKETAYPAAFVIDKNGRVQWSKISDSHGGRATVQEIIDQLGKLE